MEICCSFSLFNSHSNTKHVKYENFLVDMCVVSVIFIQIANYNAGYWNGTHMELYAAVIYTERERERKKMYLPFIRWL